MSRFILEDVTCNCCGKTSTIKRLMSTYVNRMSLDGNAHSLEQKYLEECPYCHNALMALDDETFKVNPRYLSFIQQEIKNNEIVKEVNDDSLCKALVAAKIYEKYQKFDDASYMYQLASWICSEKNHRRGSNVYRKYAIQFIQKYFETTPVIEEENLPLFIILLDLVRQTGDFHGANTLYMQLLSVFAIANVEDEKYYQKLLEFEKQLIDKRDNSDHYRDEVK